jgi:cation:H+ antiporter
MDILFILLGLVALFFGGEWLITGASRTALRLKVSPVVIGLTIVAVGTSMPELVVGVSAALQGNSGIALGNVIGSNIANVGLILGLVGMIRLIIVKDSLVKREIPIMIAVSLLAGLLLIDGELSRLDGLLLMIGFVTFNVYLYRQAKKGEGHEVEVEMLEELGTTEAEKDKVKVHIGVESIRILMGLIALIVGGQLLVEGASNIARAFGISEFVIGLTMVAVGTSLPELASSITAALKGEHDLVLGNVLGSNIANLLLILGATATIAPINVTATGLSLFEYTVMLGLAVLLIPFTLNRQLAKFESIAFLVAYFAFTIYSFLASNVPTF